MHNFAAVQNKFLIFNHKDRKDVSRMNICSVVCGGCYVGEAIR